MTWTFNILLATLLLGFCAADTLQERLANEELAIFEGIFVSDEYAYFETTSGEVFSLRIENENDQRLLAELAPLRVDGRSTCVSMYLRARIEDSNGYLDRQSLSVVQIIRATQSSCSN